jgi:hypothetical protein
MKRPGERFALGFTALLALGSAACSSDDANDPAPSGTSGRLAESARNELIAKGLNKYFGKATPTEATNAAGDTVYTFDPNDGPVCFKGAPFKTIVHETGSDNLMIYLQGGGACWRDLCQANEMAGETIGKTGICDQDPSKNVVGDWNILYVPYCDGSVFSGDNDTTGPDGTPWKFHGLQNLSAATDVGKKRFPSPKRILLAGSSAGGYGTIIGTAVVRLQYPNTELMVFNDAGLGLNNPDNPSMIEHIREDWKFNQFTPDSCTECDGQSTALINWGLKHDPTLKASAFSSYEDAIIGGVFLGMQGPAFKALLLQESGKVHSAFPTRFQRFMIAGTQHTALIGNYYTSTVDGVTLAEFTRGMVEGTASWKDLLENGGN